MLPWVTRVWSFRFEKPGLRELAEVRNCKVLLGTEDTVKGWGFTIPPETEDTVEIGGCIVLLVMGVVDEAPCWMRIPIPFVMWWLATSEKCRVTEVVRCFGLGGRAGGISSSCSTFLSLEFHGVLNCCELRGGNSCLLRSLGQTLAGLFVSLGEVLRSSGAYGETLFCSWYNELCSVDKGLFLWNWVLFSGDIVLCWGYRCLCSDEIVLCSGYRGLCSCDIVRRSTGDRIPCSGYIAPWVGDNVGFSGDKVLFSKASICVGLLTLLRAKFGRLLCGNTSGTEYSIYRVHRLSRSIHLCIHNYNCNANMAQDTTKCHNDIPLWLTVHTHCLFSSFLWVPRPLLIQYLYMYMCLHTHHKSASCLCEYLGTSLLLPTK